MHMLQKGYLHYKPLEQLVGLLLQVYNMSLPEFLQQGYPLEQHLYQDDRHQFYDQSQQIGCHLMPQ